MISNASTNAAASLVFILLVGCARVAGGLPNKCSAKQVPAWSHKHYETGIASANSLDRIASWYVRVALKAWKLDPLPHEMYGIYSRAPKKLEAAMRDVPPPTIVSLRAEIAGLQRSLAVMRGSSARREWLSLHLIAIDTRLRMLAGERFSVREEARLLFDLEVAPIPIERLKESRDQLDRLLPGQGSTHERLGAWLNSVRIPPEKIELAVRLALDESRRRSMRALKLTRGERVTVKFERGAPYGGWAEPRGDSHTILHINVGRPITLGWLTHLISHEGYPGHHVALTLLERTAKRFPEMRMLPPLSPSNTLLEGSADAIVDAIWPEAELLAWMRNELLPAIEMTHIDLALWRQLQPHIETVYSAILNVPFLLEEGSSGEEAVRFLEHYGLAERELANALVADTLDSPFPRSFTLINSKHSSAASALRSYLGDGDRALRRYADLWTTPRTPSSLVRSRSWRLTRAV